MENRKKMPVEAPENASPRSRRGTEMPPLAVKRDSWHHMTRLPPCLHKQLLQKNLKEEKRALQEEIKAFWEKSRVLRAEIKAFREDNRIKTLWEEIHNFKGRNKGFLEEIKNFLEEIRVFMLEINSFRMQKLDFQEKVGTTQEKIEAFQRKIKATEEEIASFEERNESFRIAVKAFQLKNKDFHETNKAMREKNKSLQEKLDALEEKNMSYWKECKSFWKKDKVFWEEDMAISRDKMALWEEYIALRDNDQDLQEEKAEMWDMIEALWDAKYAMWKDINEFPETQSQEVEGGKVENGADGDHDVPSGERKACDQMENRKKTPVESPSHVDPKRRKSSKTPPFSAKQDSCHPMTPLPPFLEERLILKNLEEEKQALHGNIKMFWEESRALKVEVNAFNKTTDLLTVIILELKKKLLLQRCLKISKSIGLMKMKMDSFRMEQLDFQEKVSTMQEKIKGLGEKVKAVEEEIASFEERNESFQTLSKPLRVKKSEFLQEKNKSLLVKMSYRNKCKVFWKEDRVLWKQYLVLSRENQALWEEYMASVDNGTEGKERAEGVKSGMAENGADGDHGALSGEWKKWD